MICSFIELHSSSPHSLLLGGRARPAPGLPPHHRPPIDVHRTVLLSALPRPTSNAVTDRPTHRPAHPPTDPPTGPPTDRPTHSVATGVVRPPRRAALRRNALSRCCCCCGCGPPPPPPPPPTARVSPSGARAPSCTCVGSIFRLGHITGPAPHPIRTAKLSPVELG
jgi:hypothetical protein